MSRALALILVATSFLFAGCLSDDEAPAPPNAEGTTDDAPTPPPLPEDIQESFSIVAGFDIPLPEGDEEFCWMPTNACERVAFTIPAAGVTMEAALSWTTQASNLGLFIFKGDEYLEYDSGPMNTRPSRALAYTFEEAGEYALVIDTHWGAAETADLRATFAWE